MRWKRWWKYTSIERADRDCGEAHKRSYRCRDQCICHGHLQHGDECVDDQQHHTHAERSGRGRRRKCDLSTGSTTATFAPNAALANNATYTATITTGAQAPQDPHCSPTLLVVHHCSCSGAKRYGCHADQCEHGGGYHCRRHGHFRSGDECVGFYRLDIHARAPGCRRGFGTLSYNAATNTETLTPASPLAYNTTYTATLTTGVQRSWEDRWPRITRGRSPPRQRRRHQSLRFCPPISARASPSRPL